MSNGGRRGQRRPWRDEYADKRRTDAERRARLDRDQYDPSAPAPDDPSVPAESAIRRYRDPIALGDAVSSFVQSRAWSSRLRRADVLNRWPEIVGDVVAAHARPAKLNGNVLVIEVESSAWATQLKYLTETIRQQVNEAFGSEVVTRIHLTVGRDEGGR